MFAGLKNYSGIVASIICLLTFSASEQSSCGDDISFRRHVINEQSEYSAVAVYDVDQDGRKDIVCGGWWYEAPTWRKRFVREIERIRGRFDGYSHLPLDVNGDDWIDVITVNYRSRSIRWLEHPGQAALAENVEWQIHTAEEPGAMETGRLHDIDGDGRLDVLANGQRFAAWWEVTASGGVVTWTRNELPEQAGGHGLGFGDIDGDGRGDVVGPRGWAKAPADPRKERWLWHQELNLGRASFPVLVVDVDNDGDSDLVWTRAHGFGVYWTEQSKSEQGDHTWTHHTIDSTWSQCHSPLWADMDGDGKCELVAGKRYMAHEGLDPGAYDPLIAYRYAFEPTTRTWRRSTISYGEKVGFGLDPKVTDLDGDGDLDLVACGRSGLYWLENIPSDSFSNAKTETASSTETDRTTLSARQLEQPETPFEWGRRRLQIVAAMESQLGQLPKPHERVPLEIKSTDAVATNGVTSTAIRFETGRGSLEGQLWQPDTSGEAISGDSLPAGQVPDRFLLGIPGIVAIGSLDPSLAELAARRGFVCLLVELEPNDSIDDVWKCMRCVDVLESLPRVNAERIGLVGIGQTASLATLAAAIDQRVIATLAAGNVSGTNWQPAFSLVDVIAAIAPRSITLGPSASQTPVEIAAVRKAVEHALPVFAANRFARSPSVQPIDEADFQHALTTWLDKEVRPRTFRR